MFLSEESERIIGLIFEKAVSQNMSVSAHTMNSEIFADLIRDMTTNDRDIRTKILRHCQKAFEDFISSKTNLSGGKLQYNKAIWGNF